MYSLPLAFDDVIPFFIVAFGPLVPLVYTGDNPFQLSLPCVLTYMVEFAADDVPDPQEKIKITPTKIRKILKKSLLLLLTKIFHTPV